jgi:uncharacterized membrane protein YcfT
MERRLDGIIKFLGRKVGLLSWLAFSLCSCFSFLQWILSICVFVLQEKKPKKEGYEENIRNSFVSLTYNDKDNDETILKSKLIFSLYITFQLL